ncbi:MAG: DUF481 domain-containing protein [Rhodocyclaceae bacterium]|nr:DUF481 domain-containing protein [Rhodocyclaceae bacterium]
MSRLSCLACLVLCLLPAGTAWADVVILTNGDRISGHIAHKGKERLEIRTRYAGKIALAWRHVVSITSEKPLVIQRRSDDELVRGQLVPALADHLAVETATGEVVAIPREDVAHINPTPEESGRGITYKGRANLALSANSGNSDTRRAQGEVKFTATARAFRYSLSAGGEMQEDNDATNTFKWRLGADHDRFTRRDRKRFVYGRTSLEHDRFADIRLRATTGAGYGFQVIDTPDVDLSLRLGVDLVFLERIDDNDEKYPAAGWGVRYNQVILKDKAEFFHEQGGFVELGAPSNLSVLSKTGLRFPVVDTLSASAQLNVDYEGEPGDGRKPYDTALVFGLGYDW